MKYQFVSAIITFSIIACAGLTSAAGIKETSKPTTRALTGANGMDDNDQLGCLQHFGSFMKGGPKYPSIGAGPALFNEYKCGQCFKLTYKKTGKSVVGMMNDWCTGCAPDQLDISPILSEALGFEKNTGPSGSQDPYHNADPFSVTYEPTACEGPGLSMPTLSYVFAADSKDTSLEMVILGGKFPVTDVTFNIDGKDIVGKPEGGKFRFFGFVLKKNSKIKATVKFTQGSPITDDLDISTITTGQGGGSFFNAGAKGLKDSQPVNQVDPAVFTWPDIIKGQTPV